MAVEWTVEHDPILALARELSSAMQNFQETVRQEFAAYQQEVGGTRERATDFLRSIRLADAAYCARARFAYESYRAKSEAALLAGLNEVA